MTSKEALEAKMLEAIEENGYNNFYEFGLLVVHLGEEALKHVLFDLWCDYWYDKNFDACSGSGMDVKVVCGNHEFVFYNGHYFEYRLTNGDLLGIEDWNGEEYMTHLGEYTPIYADKESGNGGRDIVGFTFFPKKVRMSDIC
jgi:hypothetical protein